jgi:hypothetical protein
VLKRRERDHALPQHPVELAPVELYRLVLKRLKAWIPSEKQSELSNKNFRLTWSGDGYKLAFWCLEKCSPTVYFAAVTLEYLGIDPNTQPLADGVAQEIAFATGVDLAKARALHPQLSDLWDRVRRDYWATIVPPTKAQRGGSNKARTFGHNEGLQ